MTRERKAEAGVSSGDPTVREELAAAFDAERRAAAGSAPETLAPETFAPETLASEPPAPETPASKRPTSEPRGRSGTGRATEPRGSETSGLESRSFERPPPSFSAEARTEWVNVPEAVKQAIIKRESEVDAGFRRYAGLGQFMKLAEGAGTNLQQALERYVATEQLLMTDPVNAMLALCQNYNIDPAQIAAAAGAAGANSATTSSLAPLTATLAHEISALQELVLANQREQVLAEVETFLADKDAHPFAGEVAADMARLLSLGACTNLREAYEAACWSNHEVRGRLIKAITTARTAEEAARAKTAADQARAAGQSITGGPAATPPQGPPETDDLREQLRQAFAAAKLA